MPDRVLIVGAGPTGLTAALNCPASESPSASSTSSPLPRRPPVPSASRRPRWNCSSCAAWRTRWSGWATPALPPASMAEARRVFRLDFTRIDSRYHYLLFISQAETERTCARRSRSRGSGSNAALSWLGWRGRALPDPNPVRVVLRPRRRPAGAGGGALARSRRGSHGAVRATLDLPFEGKTRDEQYALGDLHIDGELAETDLHIFSSEHGFLGLFPMGNRRFRLMASNPLSRPRKARRRRSRSCKRSTTSAVAGPGAVPGHELELLVPHQQPDGRALKVGRLLLGGDAAHIHSPAGTRV